MADSADAPWLTEKAWQDNRIRSSARGQLWGTGIGALLFIVAGCVAAVVVVPKALSGEEGPAAWLVLLLPLAGLVLLGLFIRKLIAWRRIGAIELELDPFPGSVGTHVGGTFHIASRVSNEASFEVAVDCLYSYVSGSGDSRSRKERSVWSNAGPAQVKADGSGAAIQFRFDVPTELPESENHLSQGEYHLWRARLTGDADGTRIDRNYTIPVFNTGARSSISHDISAKRASSDAQQLVEVESLLAEERYDETPLARHIRFSSHRRGLRLHQPMLRNKFLGTLALFFCLVPGLIAHGFLGGPGRDLFSLLGLLPAAIAVVAGIACVYLWFNALTVTVGAHDVTAIRRLLGLPVRSHRVAAQDVRKLEVVKSGSTGTGSRAVHHFKLRAVMANEQSVPVAENIDGRDNAIALRNHLGDRMALPPDALG